MESQTTEKETSRAVFALYARAVAAFPTGGELLPLAAEKAQAALGLLSTLPSLTPEQCCIREELAEYLRKSGRP